MTAYLIDHPPVRSQYRHPRRDDPSGVIVVHTAENTPDYVAFDGGAEAVARFIQSRTDPGSYHELVDSDSAILMVNYGDEAFHDATGSNPHSLSVSIATRADVWPLAPRKWRHGAVEQAAQAAARQARWVKKQTGIVIPAQRITRDESEQRVPGFISHAQRDPTRRTDPGKDFPWSDFLARYRQLTTAPDDPEDDDMPMSLTWLPDPRTPDADAHLYLVDGATGTYVDGQKAIDIAKFRGAKVDDTTKAKPADPAFLKQVHILDGPLAGL